MRDIGVFQERGLLLDYWDHYRTFEKKSMDKQM